MQSTDVLSDHTGRQDTGRGERCYGTVAHHTGRQDTGHGEGCYGTVAHHTGRQDTGRGDGCCGTLNVKIPAAARDAMVQ